MKITAIISIALGLSMDAFAISLTSGMTVKKLRASYAAKLATFFGLFQMLMPIIGWLAGVGFSEKVSAIDKYIAFVLLTIIGVKMIVETNKDKRNDEPVCKMEEQSTKIIIGLAIATSIDALAVGVTFACTGVKLFSTLLYYCGIIGVITFVICFVGTYLGEKFGSKLADKAGYLGGGILVLMGLKMLIEKLIETFA
ncbi:MAG: manganese efflux pump MntP family protein [Oscillospiraceae bacterium]